jgi:hypothetical protein
MRRKLFFCLAVVFSFVTANAQVTENFNDGDFTNNPTWVGGTSDWIVNSAFQLQSNNTVANSTFYLSTPNIKATDAEWNFYCKITFNPSSANYIDVYLTASASDLTLTNTTGYFVRIGNTADEICLYRKDATGVVTKIIDGLDGVLNTSNNAMKIKVIRDASNQWTLSRDLTGLGGSYFSEGTVTDATFTTSVFFGILVKQSTVASFAQRHFFDDISIADYIPDVTPPVLQSATVTSANSIDVLFNEALDATSATAFANYVVNNSIGFPTAVIQDGANKALVHLTFATNFGDGVANQLTVNNVKDIAGNAITNGTASFTYAVPYVAQQYDVLIDEIMADETPAVGLPEREWIELKNTTTKSINLQGWRIKDATGQSGAFPSFVLAPGAYVIVCSSTSVPDLSVYGATIAPTSFPSLNNTGEPLTLVNETGKVIHALSYTLDWYHDASKRDGGWTIEMINTKSPCTGSANWNASVDVKGGTPGKVNSVDGGTADITGPQLLNATITDPTHIILNFDETVDSLKAATIANYTITNGISVTAAATVAPLFTSVNITLSTALQTGSEYLLTAVVLTDCVGNAIGAANNVTLFLPSPPVRFDLVVNEIFYNPIPSINAQPAGVDYVEIYNRSKKVIDLSKIYLAHRNSTSGKIESLTQISPAGRLMKPQTFIVVTTDPVIVQRDFVAQDPTAFVKVNSLPTYSDDKGFVIICTADSTEIDEIQYTDKWQFPLITNTEGVALERINYDDTSFVQAEQQKNWHSAASSVGYGTPTYKNSQFRIDAGVQGEITVTPDIVSPDNDGLDDFATINYSFPEPGYVANITIFDATGRPVRYLQRNALNGTKGYYRWDGLGDKLQKLPVGIYIIYTEVFNLQGKVKKFKNIIVLARKR